MRLPHIETRNLVALAWLLLGSALIVMAIRDPLSDDMLDLFLLITLATTAPVTTALAARGHIHSGLLLAATVTLTAISQFAGYRLGYMMFAIVSLSLPVANYLGRQLRSHQAAAAQKPANR